MTHRYFGYARCRNIDDAITIFLVKDRCLRSRRSIALVNMGQVKRYVSLRPNDTGTKWAARKWAGVIASQPPAIVQSDSYLTNVMFCVGK